MNYQKDQFSCPVEATLFLIGGKYKPLILWHLIEKPLHYMELQRLIPKATPKMLSQQLRDLEECGMIHREVIPEKPPKTLYSLTAFGKSIIPVLDSMCNWGIHFLEGLDITPPIWGRVDCRLSNLYMFFSSNTGSNTCSLILYKKKRRTEPISLCPAFPISRIQIYIHCPVQCGYSHPLVYPASTCAGSD